MVAGSVYLVVTRASDALRSDARIDSLLSRESMFLANNVVFVAIAFVVFLGTFYPLITEALRREARARAAVVRRLHRAVRARARAAVRDRAGDRVAALDALAAVAQPARPGDRRRSPCSCSLPLLTRAGDSPLSLIMFAVGTFAIGIGVQELWRGMRARQAMTGEAPPRALVGVVRRNRRRYGGYLVHIGIAVMFIGVAASTAFQYERDVRLTPGPERARSAATRSPTSARPRGSRSAPGSSSGSRSARACAWRRTASSVAVLRPERAYYPINAPMVGRGEPLLRGQRDERDRPQGRHAARPVDRRAARHRRAAADHREGRQGLRRRRATSSAPSSARPPRRSVLVGLVDRYRTSAPRGAVPRSSSRRSSRSSGSAR